MFLFNRSTIFGIGLLLLTACGGGGSDPAPEPNTNCVIGVSIIGNCEI